MELKALKEEINRLSLERDSLVNSIPLKTNVIYNDTNSTITDNTILYIICGLIITGFSFYLVYTVCCSYLAYQNTFQSEHSQLLLNAITRTTEAQLQNDELLSTAIQNIDSNIGLINNVNLVNINSKIIDLDIKILELSQRMDHLITIFGPDKISPSTLSIIENIQNNPSLVYSLF